MAPTTPTQTWSASIIPAATPTVELGRRVYRVTYYGPEFQGGPLACGSDVYGHYDANDPTTIAAPLRFDDLRYIVGSGYQGKNLIVERGRRHCRECLRKRDRGRKDAAYWRAYRLRQSTLLPLSPAP